MLEQPDERTMKNIIEVIFNNYQLNRSKISLQCRLYCSLQYLAVEYLQTERTKFEYLEK